MDTDQTIYVEDLFRALERQTHFGEAWFEMCFKEEFEGCCIKGLIAYIKVLEETLKKKNCE